MEFIRGCPGQPELRARGVAEYPPQQGRLPDSLLSLDEQGTADSGGQPGEHVPQYRQLVVTASEEIALRGRPRTRRTHTGGPVTTGVHEKSVLATDRTIAAIP